MSEIEIHELSAAYALDALDDAERAAYEAHFATCPICKTQVVEHRETAATLATLNVAAPPSGLKTDVMARIATTRQIAPRAVAGRPDAHRRRRLAPALLAAAAVLLVVAGAALVIVQGRPSFNEQVAQMMDDPSTRVVELDGQAGSLKLVWDDEHVAVLGDDLPAPQPGMRYELWMIDAAGAHPAGMLDPAEGGTVRRMLDAHGEPHAWGVTIEPAAGSPAPTGPVLYQAEVQQQA